MGFNPLFTPILFPLPCAHDGEHQKGSSCAFLFQVPLPPGHGEERLEEGLFTVKIGILG